MIQDLHQQISELVKVHKGLTGITESDREVTVSGTLPFEASAKDGLETITESFEIELTIPQNFPDRLPSVKETGNRISIDYDHRNASGTLCLAVPIEQRRIFLEEPTLLGFVNRLVIPYLYGYCFWEKHGYHPFSEAAHGNEGILQHYIDTLKLPDELTAFKVICFLSDYGYRGHHTCPCGSTLKVRDCHGPGLLKLHQTHNYQSLRNDLVAIFNFCYSKYKNEMLSFPRPLQRQILRLINRFKLAEK